ncbi:MAG: cupin domain-containing protein [Steroidobacteraceae bacterium]|nr:cupin domain-containing protein [Steroidobacteraceae bacterium]MDW8260853.1 cupin domain-containing protein [Gammaproteobacteria bacterium]
MNSAICSKGASESLLQKIVLARPAALELVAGDAFVIPRGFEGVWDVLEPVVKLYAIFEPHSS